MKKQSCKSFIRKPVSAYYIKKIFSRIIENKIDLVTNFVRTSGDINNSDFNYIIRVDDYPHWKHSLEEFKEFHRVMALFNTFYLLGVIPRPSLNPLDTKNRKARALTDTEKHFLRQIVKDGVETGMHGFTHQNYYKNVKSELIHVDKNMDEEIKKGLEVFKTLAIEPVAFIPPFNTLNKSNLNVISRYFKIITGGEETIRYLGYYWGMVEINKVTYIPCYPPLYNRAEEIYEYLKVTSEARICERVNLRYIPITLHWSWELKDKFKGLEKLLSLIRDKTVSWSKVIE